MVASEPCASWKQSSRKIDEGRIGKKSLITVSILFVDCVCFQVLDHCYIIELRDNMRQKSGHGEVRVYSNYFLPLFHAI